MILNLDSDLTALMGQMQGGKTRITYQEGGSQNRGGGAEWAGIGHSFAVDAPEYCIDGEFMPRPLTGSRGKMLF